MLKMKSVLLLGSELGIGGAQRSISLLSHYLQEDYDVTLCVLSGKGRDNIFKASDKIVFVDPPEHKSIFGKIKAWRYRLKFIRKFKQDNDIDVCISFLEGPDYVNILTRGKGKAVLSIRGSKMFDKEIGGITGLIRKKILIPYFYRKADQVVCVSNGLADELHKYFGIKQDRLKTIYNFYDIEDIQQKSNESLTEDEKQIFSKPVIITSGRLHMSKRYDSLIKVLKQLEQKIDARLVILGDGPLKSELLALTKSLGLKACDWSKGQKYEDADVYFMGFQSNVFKFYKHSNLFALTSDYEGFPNVMAEALICYVPVVATDCHTGPREILDVHGLKPYIPTEIVRRTQVGSLLPMLDIVDQHKLIVWADEMEYWLHAQRPSVQAFNEITNRFTKAAMLKQWKDVIDN